MPKKKPQLVPNRRNKINEALRCDFVDIMEHYDLTDYIILARESGGHCITGFHISDPIKLDIMLDSLGDELVEEGLLDENYAIEFENDY
jgi:hypothetical protein